MYVWADCFPNAYFSPTADHWWWHQRLTVLDLLPLSFLLLGLLLFWTHICLWLVFAFAFFWHSFRWPNTSIADSFKFLIFLIFLILFIKYFHFIPVRGLTVFCAKKWHRNCSQPIKPKNRWPCCQAIDCPRLLAALVRPICRLGNGGVLGLVLGTIGGKSGAQMGRTEKIIIWYLPSKPQKPTLLDCAYLNVKCEIIPPLPNANARAPMHCSGRPRNPPATITFMRKKKALLHLYGTNMYHLNDTRFYLGMSSYLASQFATSLLRPSPIVLLLGSCVRMS